MLKKFMVTFGCLSLALVMLPMSAMANSMPVYLGQYPGFNIAPLNDVPIRVDREELVFEIDENSSDLAMVTARYTLTNDFSEHQTVAMVFPYISYGYGSMGAAEIELNGQPVDYRVFGAGHVEVRDYLEDPDGFREQSDIDGIIAKLNEPLYRPEHFDDTGEATLYEVTFNPPSERQCRISFTIDPDETLVLTFGFNGLEVSNNGEATVFSYVSEKRVGDKGYILVLGQDTLANMKSELGGTIQRSTVVAKDFIISKSELWAGFENRDQTNLYGSLLREIDRFYEQGQWVFDYDMVIGNVFGYNNISVLLYEVELTPGSTDVMQVAFPMLATIDRRDSVDYVNTFAYLLNPAQNFSDFGGIDIVVELNDKNPYIIDSTLPLTEEGPLVYRASLDNLPSEDLVFSTYPRSEITFADRMQARVLPRGYGGLLGMVVLALFLVVLSLPFIKRGVRK